MKVLRTILLSVFAFCIISCSSDDEKIDYINLYPSISEEYRTDTINGWAISRDETERVCYLRFFQAGQDPIEKLYGSPTSFDEVKHLFPLSEGNEIRLTDKGEIEASEGFPEYKQYFEDYIQYYKGVPVDSYARFYYYITPQGKRMSYAMIEPFIDIKNLDPNPSISEQEARQIFANHLKVTRDDTWRCSLDIKEFSSRNSKGIIRNQRLVYLVWGPYAPGDPGIMYIRAPQYHALIDAHTGEIIYLSI